MVTTEKYDSYSKKFLLVACTIIVLSNKAMYSKFHHAKYSN